MSVTEIVEISLFVISTIIVTDIYVHSLVELKIKNYVVHTLCDYASSSASLESVTCCNMSPGYDLTLIETNPTKQSPS